MGVIKFQSIRYSVFNALAVFLGAFAILFVIPYDKTSYGVVNMIFAAAYLLSPVIGLGLPMVIIKFFPVFKNKQSEENYLGFALILTAVVTGILSLVLLLFYDEFTYIATFFRLDGEFLKQNKFTIVFLSMLLVFNYVIISFSALQKKIAIPELLSNVAYKIFVPSLIMVVYFNLVSSNFLGTGIITFYLLSTLAIFIYVFRMKSWSWPEWNLISKAESKELLSFLIQSGIQTLSNGLILRLDILLVGLMLGALEAGIYGIILFMTSTLEIASKAISQISAPIISQKWNEGDLAEIEKIYSKSAVVLTVISCFLFLLLYFNFPYIFGIMPQTEYRADWRWVMVILSVARIIDLGFSLNGVILTYSNLMKYNIAFLILSGITYFILLVNLLPSMGMEGAAISYLIVILLFNLAKHILIKLKWKLDPISMSLFKAVGGACVCMAFMLLIPSVDNAWLGLFINTILISAIYLGIVIILKPSDDIDTMMKNIKARLIK